jgi:uncharacterized protein (UPF0248 family)
VREHPLRRILSSILRGGRDPSSFELAYRHRGAPHDKIVIKVSEVKYVGKGWFLLSDGETQIPFHRILYIKDEKSTLWEKRPHLL